MGPTATHRASLPRRHPLRQCTFAPPLAPLRRPSLVAGPLVLGAAMVPAAHAADADAQRVALACTQAGDAACKPIAAHHATTQAVRHAPEATPAKVRKA